MSTIKEHYQDQIEAAQRGKERPILFTTDMVRAIIEDRKTQSRRIINQKNLKQSPNNWLWLGHSLEYTHFGFENKYFGTAPNELHIKNPYGQPGDLLWVRETWMKGESNGVDGYHYRATYLDDVLFDENQKWKPSIHMPRAAARIFLEITDIRAQRLHDITEAEAIVEGIGRTRPNNGQNYFYDNYHTGRWMEPEMLNNPIASYRTLWETINGPGSWELNPWVWVINFKKIG